MFPTGKPHVSFSEIKAWKECSWRHKLIYIDKIDKGDIFGLLRFGSRVDLYFPPSYDIKV